jgi:hypothetical protein
MHITRYTILTYSKNTRNFLLVSVDDIRGKNATHGEVFISAQKQQHVKIWTPKQFKLTTSAEVVIDALKK